MFDLCDTAMDVGVRGHAHTASVLKKKSNILERV